MKSPVQRMIAQRRLALVTERTPLQPGNLCQDEQRSAFYIGCDFAADGSRDGQYTCLMSQMERVIFAVFSRVQADATPPRVLTQYEKLVAAMGLRANGGGVWEASAGKWT